MSNAVNLIIEELTEKADYHRDQLWKLEAALEVLADLGEKDKNGDASPPAPPSPSPPERKAPYPTEAIRSLFDADPARPWRPKEVVSELQSMMDRGELQAKKGRKPEEFAYSIIADLAKHGFLKKLPPPPGSRSPYYIRATKRETHRVEDELGF